MSEVDGADRLTGTYAVGAPLHKSVDPSAYFTGIIRCSYGDPGHIT
jgi:hypothetical protein